MWKRLRVFFLIILLTIVATFIALPAEVPIKFTALNKKVDFTVKRPPLNFNLLGTQVQNDLVLKEGLDIQGGIQVTLKADMSAIAPADRQKALDSAKEIIQRRVDLYGVNEPLVQSAQSGDEYRIIVELAGVNDAQQALQLIGTTAQLDFRLPDSSPSAESTQSAIAFFNSFQKTGLTGKQLKSATVQLDPQTGAPSVSIQFNDEGKDIFAKITQENVGKILAIFLDDTPIMLPTIQGPILTGQGSITGSMTIDTAKELAIQLSAGALPVPIQVIQQQTIGASLGQKSVQQSVQAGLIGVILVIVFMILNYRFKGLLASVALIIYALLTISVYKLFGVTLTLPGIAGLILSVGMAVDSNILIFERMKEETRVGKTFEQAMELGFDRAWNSIKDANLTTIFISLILINPLDLSFLNQSGLVKGFGLTLFIGVILSLFTSMVVSRTFMRLFLKGDN
ncbi:protein translocase subunit SecD [soil metagenome]